MNVTVVTSFSPRGLQEYGWRFMRTFKEFWPSSVELVVYYEGEMPRMEGEINFRDLTIVPDRAAFMWAHGIDPMKNGRVPTPKWKPKDIDDGYSFRSDAVKFSNKVFAINDALEESLDRVNHALVWIDADSYSHAFVPEWFIPDMLAGADVAFLGRGDAYHSECGFLAFRQDTGGKLIRAWALQYMSGEVFNLPETHDSYVFDAVRKRVRVRERNLTEPGPNAHGHPWFASPLCRYMDHLKGKRKERGFSSEMSEFHHRNPGNLT